MAVGIAFPPGNRRDEEHDDGEPHERERREARLTVDVAGAAQPQRETEHEQEVADDATRQRPADDLGETLLDGDERDDQLRRVAERGVEEAADPRARVVRRVLGRLSDQPCERDERDRREHELGHLIEVCDVVEEDDERAERERGREDLAHHAGNPIRPRRETISVRNPPLCLNRAPKSSLAAGVTVWPQSGS